MHNINSEYNRLKTSQQIIFLDENFRGVKTLYDDAIIISIAITNFEVQKIIVDSKSAINVLFLWCIWKDKTLKGKTNGIPKPIV